MDTYNFTAAINNIEEIKQAFEKQGKIFAYSVGMRVEGQDKIAFGMTDCPKDFLANYLLTSAEKMWKE